MYNLRKYANILCGKVKLFFSRNLNFLHRFLLPLIV